MGREAAAGVGEAEVVEDGRGDLGERAVAVQRLDEVEQQHRSPGRQARHGREVEAELHRLAAVAEATQGGDDGLCGDDGVCLVRAIRRCPVEDRQIVGPGHAGMRRRRFACARPTPVRSFAACRISPISDS
jgi:hypothetical protein